MALDVAIVGCGYFSQFHQDAWKRSPEARVVAVVDADTGKATAAAAAFADARVFSSVDEMIAAGVRPRLLDIVTPSATHLPLVAFAARHGIDAICQKPLAPDFAEAVRIVETAEAGGIRLMVHENFRFMPWFGEARRVLDQGLLGTPLGIFFRLRPGDGQGPGAYLGRQPYFQKMSRFLVHETAIHLIDVFRYLLGEPTAVFARLKRFNPVIAGEDAGVIVLDFAKGATGVFDGNRHVDHPADDARMTMGVMYLEGTGGTLRLDGYGGLHLKPHGKPEAPWSYAWENRAYGGDCAYHQIRHALAYFADGAEPMNTGRAYLRNLEIQEAIYRSAEERRMIDL